MRALTRYILALFDLAAAEARSLRRSVFRLGVALALACAGALLLVAALAMGTCAIFAVLVSAGLGAAGAAAICAAIFLILSLAVLWVARCLAK